MTKSIEKISPIKYCLGLDVSEAQLAVCFSQLDSQQQVVVKSSRKVGNTPQGWKAMLAWAGRFRKLPDVPFLIVMEATGVYYESCAYYCKEQGHGVSVVLPNRSKHYARSLNVKSKNDDVDARTLAQMGLERALPLWQGMSPIMLTLKRLSRERTAIQEGRTRLLNQLHAHEHSHLPHKPTLRRLRQHLALLDKQVVTIEKEIAQTCGQDAELKQKVDNVCTIKGIGLLTAVAVIAEANGFELIQNKAQLVSYAGYDVVENQSGTSIKGKTRISKKGNSHIRRALYFPALTAAHHEPKLEALYQRIQQKNPKVKMIGAVAVQRKLLVLIYTLYKKNEPYDPQYEAKPAA